GERMRKLVSHQKRRVEGCQGAGQVDGRSRANERRSVETQGARTLDGEGDALGLTEVAGRSKPLRERVLVPGPEDAARLRARPLAPETRDLDAGVRCGAGQAFEVLYRSVARQDHVALAHDLERRQLPRQVMLRAGQEVPGRLPDRVDAHDSESSVDGR